MDFISVGQLALWHHLPGAAPAKTKRKPVTRGRVLLVHGLSEHSGRHTNTINALLSAGWEVVRFDLRGAGHSGGKRQYIDHWNDYVEDTAQALAWIQRDLEPLPLVLLGHSLGGAIGVYFAATYNRSLSGLILSAPAYQAGDSISPFKIALAKLLAGVTPSLRVPQNISQNTLSRDLEVETAYRADPLCSHFNTVRQGMEILGALERIPALAETITVPTLIAHGTHDKVIKLEGSFQLLKRLKSEDKTMCILPGGFHEPHNDTDKEQYFSALNQWLDKRFS